MSLNITLMDFSQALKMLKEGHTISREDWRDSKMFLYLVPESTYSSFTDVAKKEFGEKVQYGAYIAIKTHQHYVVPWQPTNTDILASDWKVYSKMHSE